MEKRPNTMISELSHQNNLTNKGEYIYLPVVIVGVMLFVIPIVSLLIPNAYTGFIPAKLLPAAIGQDIITLFISPLLLLLVQFRKRDHSRAAIIGILLYAIYAYSIYALAAIYNHYFFSYIAIIGLSFYSMINLHKRANEDSSQKKIENRMSNAITGIYLISTGTIFALFWIISILKSMLSQLPPNGINTVFVLDLAIILPAFVISGVQLLQGKYQGYVHSEIMLVFIIILGFSILSGFIFSSMQGIGIEMGRYVMFTLFTLIGLLVYKINYH